MSRVRDAVTDQRPPIAGTGAHIHDLVEEDIASRKRIGVKKYGMPLQANNGRDMLWDAYEEALDLAIYLRGELENRKGE